MAGGVAAVSVVVVVSPLLETWISQMKVKVMILEDLCTRLHRAYPLTGASTDFRLEATISERIYLSQLGGYSARSRSFLSLFLALYLAGIEKLTSWLVGSS